MADELVQVGVALEVGGRRLTYVPKTLECAKKYAEHLFKRAFNNEWRVPLDQISFIEIWERRLNGAEESLQPDSLADTNN